VRLSTAGKGRSRTCRTMYTATKVCYQTTKPCGRGSTAGKGRSRTRRIGRRAEQYCCSSQGASGAEL